MEFKTTNWYEFLDHQTFINHEWKIWNFILCSLNFIATFIGVGGTVLFELFYREILWTTEDEETPTGWTQSYFIGQVAKMQHHCGYKQRSMVHLPASQTRSGDLLLGKRPKQAESPRKMDRDMPIPRCKSLK